MSWINKYMSQEELSTIEAAIQLAETETRGEIVPVIVKRSSSVGHVPLSLTLLFLLLIIAVEIPYSEWLWVRPWVWAWPVVIVAIYLLSHVIAKIPFIQKIFVPERDEVDSVHQRAQLEFYANKINRTENGTGILIFVSAMEKKAVILADEGIAKKLPADIWDQVLNDLRVHLHKGDWAAAYKAAISRSGELLKTHFPLEGPLRNELTNHLIIKD